MKKKLMLILVALATLGFRTLSYAQTEGVTLEILEQSPQSGPHNHFGARVTLDQTYAENVTVHGYIYDESDHNQNNPFTLIVTTGNLSAETSANYCELDATAIGAGEISSVTPKTVTYYSNVFLTSPAFDTLIAAIGHYSMNIMGQLLQQGGTPLSDSFMTLLQTEGGVDSTDLSNFHNAHSLNDSTMLDNELVVIAAYAGFMVEQADFFATLSETEQDQVFSAIRTTLKDETFLSNNPSNILVVRIGDILERVNYGQARINSRPNSILGLSMIGAFPNRYLNYKLSWEEVVDCLLDAVGGAVFAGLSGSLSVLWGIFTGGGGIRSIVRQIGRVLGAFGKLVPFGALAGFGWCLIYHTFDWSFWDIF